MFSKNKYSYLTFQTNEVVTSFGKKQHSNYLEKD